MRGRTAQPGPIVLVGSSIFEQWASAPGLAAGAPVVNRAVGGTVTSYWIDNLSEVLAAERPDVVLFYCGSNDLTDGVPAREIVANVERCRSIVSGSGEGPRFAWFDIMKAPQKRELGAWPIIDEVNASVRADLPAGDLAVDTNAVVHDDGEPIAEYFVEDGLHLTAAAYEALSASVRPLLGEWLGG